jgi:hypothetical protein
MRRRTLVVALTALGLVACTRGGLSPERVQAWVGRPAAELVREWGAPTKEVDDGGQRVMIYEEVERTRGGEFQKQVTARQAGSTEAAAAANAAAQGPTTYVRSYLFWVDTAGKITRTQIRQP